MKTHHIQKMHHKSHVSLPLKQAVNCKAEKEAKHHNDGEKLCVLACGDAVPPLSNALYKGHQNFPNKGHFSNKITSLKDAKMQISSAAQTNYYQINAGCS